MPDFELHDLVADLVEKNADLGGKLPVVCRQGGAPGIVDLIPSLFEKDRFREINLGLSYATSTLVRCAVSATKQS